MTASERGRRGSGRRSRVLRVAAIADDPELARSWRALADATGRPNPFHRPEVVVAAARHLPAAADADLLLVESQDQVDLALPFLPRQRVGRAPGRATVPLDHDHSLLGTPLARDHGADLWRDALDALAGATDDDWAVFAEIDADVATAIADASAARGRTALILPVRSRAFTRRRPDGDYLESQISGRSLKSLRRHRRRLADEVGGDVAVVDLIERDGVEAAVSRFIELEKAGWKGQDGGAIGCHPAQVRFMHELCAGMAATGRLDIYGLEGADGTLAAAAVDFVDEPGWFTFKVTYNEDVGDHSPGRLLERDAFERFHDSGLDFMDSCASVNNAGQHRIFGGERDLTTVVVSLRGVRGDAAARLAYAVLRLQVATRDARRWWRDGGRDEIVGRIARVRDDVADRLTRR